ncbi:hypothetical protein ABKY80_003694 [Vibrio harveyi]
MANIATAVRIAVDSGQLDNARNTAKEFTEEVRNRLPAGFTRAAGAAGAVVAGLAAAYATAQKITEETEAQVQRSYDFTNNVDSSLRPAMVYVAEQFAAMNAQAEQFDDLIALADSDWTMKFSAFGNTIREYWTTFRTGGRDAEQIVDDLIAKIAEAQGRSVESVRDEMNALNEAAQSLSDAAFERQLLGYRRLSMTSREYREEQMRLLQIEHDAQVALADSPEQAAALQRRLDRVMDAQRQMNAALDDQEAENESKRQQSIQDEIRMMEIQNMNAEAALQARWEMERDAIIRRYEAEELSADQMNMMRIELAKQYQSEALSLQERANQDALRETEKTTREMSNATSTALSLLDDDLASVYDSINSLVAIVQSLGWLTGSGGIMGIGGGFSSGGMSSYGGVNVGSLSVTVNGGTERTAQHAQEGVNSALSGIVREQMAQEQRYGGLLNPKQSVQRI